MKRAHSKVKLLVAILYITACTPSITLTPTQTISEIIPITFTPIPVSTLTPQPTTSPEPSPTATIDYHSLTNEEKLAYSQNLVEQVSGYNGNVEVKLSLNGTTYHIYWDASRNEWRSDHNTPAEELDKTGESFPDIVTPGYQNPDGSLVEVDPVTGQETVFPKPTLPGKGEMSLEEFYGLGQINLGKYIIDDIVIPSLDSTNTEEALVSEAMKNQAVFLGGYICDPEQNNLYASLTNINGNFEASERPTNQFCIPIYSPETGNFMFFLNIQQGNTSNTRFFEYLEDGTIEAYYLGGVDPKNFGNDGKDKFGVIVENRRPDLSHWEGGGTPLLQGNTGIGSITEVEAILNAKTEDEVFKILQKYKIFVSYPTRIVAPKN